MEADTEKLVLPMIFNRIQSYRLCLGSVKPDVSPFSYKHASDARGSDLQGRRKLREYNIVERSTRRGSNARASSDVNGSNERGSSDLYGSNGRGSIPRDSNRVQRDSLKLPGKDEGHVSCM